MESEIPPPVSESRFGTALIAGIYALYICSWILSGVTAGLLRWAARQLGVSIGAVAWALSAWLGFVGWVFWKIWVLWPSIPSFSALCGPACW